MNKLNTEFEVGQLWKCSSVSSNSQHKAIIVSFDSFKDEDVVGVAILSEDSGSAPFMPFSIKAFSASVLELIDSGKDVSSFVDGYNYWKELYVDGEAGVYDISVDEVLNLDN